MGVRKSSPQSDSTTSTSNVDRRVVADAEAVGVSGDFNSIAITKTDLGAIREAFGFAGNVQAGQERTALELIGIADRVFSDAFETIGQSAALVKQSGDNVAAAYSEARGAGTEKMVLTVAALAVVGVVAVKAWGK